jgi:uncharacterized protein (DUF1800 family)
VSLLHGVTKLLLKTAIDDNEIEGHALYPDKNYIGAYAMSVLFQQSLRDAVSCATLGLLVACSTASKPHTARPSPVAAVAPVIVKTAAPGYAAPGATLQAAKVDPDKLLNRISWGANASSSAALQTLGMDPYLDQQLHRPSAVLPAAIQAQIDGMTIVQQPFPQMMFALEAQREAAAQKKGSDDTLRKAYQQELTRLAREAVSRSLLRAVYSPAQLQEQMVWFWMNHFNISNQKQNLRAMLGDFEEQAIRPYALGNFRDLLGATVMHPAMLRYLDNEHNAVGRINENYARELMELHTMGVGSGYSQTDVQELARVLTGVGVNLSSTAPRLRADLQKAYFRKGLFEFNPKRHDFGDKQLLGKRIRGRGLPELDETINLLSRQPATARFISRKLAMYFVSDSPSPALIDSMAQSFLRNDGDIPSMLKTMFDTPEFAASLGLKFKDPLHYVIASVRLAYDGASIVNSSPMLNWLNNLGQQSNGHQTPDGYSLEESSWASPAQMASRFDIAKTIAAGSPGLFRSENSELKIAAKDLPRPALANSEYVKNWVKKFSPQSQQALQQAGSPQEWAAFFLASPEMMRR